MNSALRVYDAAIASATSAIEGETLTMRFADGTAHEMPYGDWCLGEIPGDKSILERCQEPTLDIGCGPGRLVSALVRAGIPSLGIDISEESMRQTRERGGLAMRRSVFSRVPGEKRWATVLLADGNIGIGGEPVELLRRCKDLIRPGGSIIVEMLGPDVESKSGAVRMESGGILSDWFPWAHMSITDTAESARLAGLIVAEEWVSDERWFASFMTAE